MTEVEAVGHFKDTDALISDSHVVYASEKHGTTYVDKDAAYAHTQRISLLCRGLAERCADVRPDATIAPAIGGAILSQWTAHHLGDILGRPVLATYAERETSTVFTAAVQTTLRINGKDIPLEAGDEVIVRKPRFVVRPRYEKLIAGRRVLGLDDVLTSGGSGKGVVEEARRIKAEVVGFGSLWNRGGVTAQDVGDVPHFETLVNRRFKEWDPHACAQSGPCSKSVPINSDVGRGREFLAQQATAAEEKS